MYIHSRFIDGLVYVRDEYCDGWKRKYAERLLPMATKWNESPKTSPESNPKMSKNWDCEWVAVDSEHFEYNIFIWKKSFYMEYSGHMTFMWNETRLHFDLYGDREWLRPVSQRARICYELCHWLLWSITVTLICTPLHSLITSLLFGDEPTFPFQTKQYKIFKSLWKWQFEIFIIKLKIFHTDK